MRQTRRRHTSIAAFAIVSALVIASCGGDDDDATDDAATTEADAGAAATTAAAAETTEAAAETTEAAAETTEADGTDSTAAGGGGGDLEQLAADCTEEGQVNLIALPDEWANYKGILAELPREVPRRRATRSPTPEASSREEMEAVQTLAGQDDMPDSVDVSPAIAQEMVDDGLFEPYMPTVIDEIPDGLVDADNNWIAAYYGIMAILTNTTIVPNAPQTFADLKKPEYEGLVALNGDPRESGAAFAAVDGGGARQRRQRRRHHARHRVLRRAQGVRQPRWRRRHPGDRAVRRDADRHRLELQPARSGGRSRGSRPDRRDDFPTDGVYGGFYGQGVVKDSPHPACAKLWIEHILSDEGALGYLEGGAMPARFEALVEAGLVDRADMEQPAARRADRPGRVPHAGPDRRGATRC